MFSKINGLMTCDALTSFTLKTAKAPIITTK